MRTQLKNLDKARIFLCSVHFKQILSFLIMKELKGIEGTTHESLVGSHKSQALGRSLSDDMDLPKQE